MEKTELGISVGLFGAIIFAVALFGGYIPSILLVGYVLLMETNEWLRKSAVKALATLASFSVLMLLIGLIPDVLNWIASLINVFGASIYFSFINSVFNVINSLIGIMKELVFVALIFKALSQGTVKLPVVDNLINKYM